MVDIVFRFHKKCGGNYQIWAGYSKIYTFFNIFISQIQHMKKERLFLKRLKPILGI